MSEATPDPTPEPTREMLDVPWFASWLYDHEALPYVQYILATLAYIFVTYNLATWISTKGIGKKGGVNFDSFWIVFVICFIPGGQLLMIGLAFWAMFKSRRRMRG